MKFEKFVQTPREAERGGPRLVRPGVGTEGTRCGLEEPARGQERGESEEVETDGCYDWKFWHLAGGPALRLKAGSWRPLLPRGVSEGSCTQREQTEGAQPPDFLTNFDVDEAMEPGPRNEHSEQAADARPSFALATCVVACPRMLAVLARIKARSERPAAQAPLPGSSATSNDMRGR